MENLRGGEWGDQSELQAVSGVGVTARLNVCGR